MKELVRKLGSFFLDIIQTVVLALSIFVISYLFLFQPHQVRGNSMYQNFHDQEFLLTDKVSYRFGKPQRGDVVIFKAPPSEPCAETECEYIKRVIGLPGEKVRISEGSIFINDQKLNEDYLPSALKTQPGSFFRDGKTITLSQDEYFVAGDNRLHSRDGREFGPIKREAIIGKAWFRYWPISRLGLIPKAKFH
ncbi:MAG: signal peptidase I [Patescibacteria group bacterium]